MKFSSKIVSVWSTAVNKIRSYIIFMHRFQISQSFSDKVSIFSYSFYILVKECKLYIKKQKSYFRKPRVVTKYNPNAWRLRRTEALDHKGAKRYRVLLLPFACGGPFPPPNSPIFGMYIVTTFGKRKCYKMQLLTQP